MFLKFSFDPVDLLMKIISASIAILAPLSDIIIATVFFVGVNFFSGIYKSWKLYGRKSIKAKMIYKTPVKLTEYMAIFIVSQVFEEFINHRVLEDDFPVPMIKITALFISIREVKSIFENIGQASGFSLWEYVERHIKKLK